MDPVWLQGVFDTLNGLFDRVGIQKNARKTVGMISCPCRTVLTQSEASYERWMTGEGLTYQAFHQLRVQCPECGVDLAAGLLAVHWQTQHGVAMVMGAGDQWDNPPA